MVARTWYTEGARGTPYTMHARNGREPINVLDELEAEEGGDYQLRSDLDKMGFIEQPVYTQLPLS